MAARALTPEGHCSESQEHGLSSDFVGAVGLGHVADIDSDEMDEILCAICMKESKTITSDGACLECKMPMCDTCLHNHTTQEVTKDHLTATMDKLNKNPRLRLKFEKRFICTMHKGGKVNTYCPIHKLVCCMECRDIHHRSCSEVTDIASIAKRLLQEMKTTEMLDDLNDCEKRLENCIEKNNSNLVTLSSQVPDLLQKLKEMKKTFNRLFDDLEEKVKSEGEMFTKREKSHVNKNTLYCQNVINNVRKSRRALEKVIEYGTEQQIFVTACTAKRVLVEYNRQTLKQQQHIKPATLRLEIIPQLESFLSQVTSMGQLICVKEEQNAPVSTSAIVKTTFNPRQFVNTRRVKISQPNTDKVDYIGITSVMADYLVLADWMNQRVVLVNSDYCYITHLQLSSNPVSVCTTTSTTAVVTLPRSKQINMLEVNDTTIKLSNTINTQYPCRGISPAGDGRLAVCGETDKDGVYYWRFVSSSGVEGPSHLIDRCSPGPASRIAVNVNMSRVYVSLSYSDIVVCHDIEGNELFRYNRDNLLFPSSACHDEEGQVYVMGFNSDNIHQMSPYGNNIQVLTDGVPPKPQSICLSHNNRFTVTAQYDDHVTVFTLQ